MKIRTVLPACLLMAAPTAFGQSLLLDLVGNDALDQYGTSSIAIDDINGDGVPDLAIGAPTAGLGGEVYVTSGADGALIRTLVAPGQLQPPDSETYYGFCLSALGDQDGDGIGEIAIGIPGQQLFTGERNGAVQVVSGATGAAILLAVGVNSGASFGAGIANGGDVDGDGFDDLWVGAPNAFIQGQRRGIATLLSVATASYLQTISGPSDRSSFGDTIAVLPDVDGDGEDDLVVTAPGDSDPGGLTAGSVSTFSGATGALLFRIYGTTTTRFSNVHVAAVPDTNGDGISDIAIGARRGFVAGSENGIVRLISGSDGSLIRNVLGQNAGAEFGHFVAGIDDLDGDGAGELLVGEPFFGGGLTSIGAFHVISGGTGQTLHRRTGNEPGAFLGLRVANLGDLDGDGTPEYAASSYTRNGMTNGALSIYLGADAPVIRQCQNAIPNSTGQVSVMGFEGTSRVAFNRATLRTDRLPPGVFGLYITSRVYQILPIPGGTFAQLCIGGDLGRINQVLQASPSGSFSLDIDLTALPTTNAFVAATPGETWHFQAWHRDTPSGASWGFNLSDTVGILMR